ncbi:Uncharacterised protein [Streptococcus pneumoniae]|nr:Uncharacterised protein [Streptococcus pneumoniae]
MNIKALIKKYEELWNEHSPFYEPVPYTSMVELFLKELKQLDEPEKVKVPQFMADWIDYFKKNGDWDLFQAKTTKTSSLVLGLTATRSRKRSGIW